MAAIEYIKLPPSTTMTPVQALHSALGADLTDVLIIGWDTDGDLVIRSSRMDCKQALWLSEKAKAYALSGGLER